MSQGVGPEHLLAQDASAARPGAELNRSSSNQNLVLMISAMDVRLRKLAAAVDGKMDATVSSPSKADMDVKVVQLEEAINAKLQRLDEAVASKADFVAFQKLKIDADARIQRLEATTVEVQSSFSAKSSMTDAMMGRLAAALAALETKLDLAAADKIATLHGELIARMQTIDEAIVANVDFATFNNLRRESQTRLQRLEDATADLLEKSCALKSDVSTMPSESHQEIDSRLGSLEDIISGKADLTTVHMLKQDSDNTAQILENRMLRLEAATAEMISTTESMDKTIKCCLDMQTSANVDEAAVAADFQKASKADILSAGFQANRARFDARAQEQEQFLDQTFELEGLESDASVEVAGDILKGGLQDNAVRALDEMQARVERLNAEALAALCHQQREGIPLAEVVPTRCGTPILSNAMGGMADYPPSMCSDAGSYDAQTAFAAVLSATTPADPQPAFPCVLSATAPSVPMSPPSASDRGLRALPRATSAELPRQQTSWQPHGTQSDCVVVMPGTPNMATTPQRHIAIPCDPVKHVVKRQISWPGLPPTAIPREHAAAPRGLLTTAPAPLIPGPPAAIRALSPAASPERSPREHPSGSPRASPQRSPRPSRSLSPERGVHNAGAPPPSSSPRPLVEHAQHSFRPVPTMRSSPLPGAPVPVMIANWQGSPALVPLVRR
eukprot:gnl/TRDRNA2_/TRDRNA2_80564_c0_seq1.p1 gnl/TRDRNA2_/TRDRNA2_80564_c0~~gnl/TRDRNA2_/TRDRNA2_80564_c0_seq1.p1  ORF type:complete len:675 (+),score=116.71 gnl/TRDRNA2_/TRDRNA2_80564_c0_seq1:54-2078(+)